MSTAEDVLQAARRYFEADAEIREKRAEIQYDAAYFLHREYEERERAAAEFDEALAEYVNARIESAIHAAEGRAARRADVTVGVATTGIATA